MDIKVVLLLIPGLIAWFIIELLKVPKKFRSPATLISAIVVYILLLQVPELKQFATNVFLSILSAGTINGIRKTVYNPGGT